MQRAPTEGFNQTAQPSLQVPMIGFRGLGALGLGVRGLGFRGLGLGFRV